MDAPEFRKVRFFQAPPQDVIFMLLQTRALLFAVVCALVSLSGCAQSKVTITGKIIKGGKPLIVSKDTYVTLQFLPESVASESASQSYSASFDQETGTFRLDLSPGRYKTNFIMALPAKGGQLSKPSTPVKGCSV